MQPLLVSLIDELRAYEFVGVDTGKIVIGVIAQNLLSALSTAGVGTTSIAMVREGPDDKLQVIYKQVNMCISKYQQTLIADMQATVVGHKPVLTLSKILKQPRQYFHRIK